jgi:hypothetical protein
LDIYVRIGLNERFQNLSGLRAFSLSSPYQRRLAGVVFRIVVSTALDRTPQLTEACRIGTV